MAPIYDSDLAEGRFSKAEWSHYELWEKVEHRLRRHNRFWIASTAVLFLVLSSIPVVIDQRPRWAALSGIRHLSEQISRLKREAAIEHAPLRILFRGDGSLAYRIERVAKCGDPEGALVGTGSLLPPGEAGAYRLLTRSDGETLSIPALAQQFCYDPLSGSAPFSAGKSLVGFAIAPAKDLTARRLDRVSVLLVSGPGAELSFE